MRIPITSDQIRSMYDKHQYPVDENAINIWGKRSKDRTADKWNDTLGIWVPNNNFIMAVSGTTDPGKSPLSKTEGVNKNGIFILMPGFYKNCWQKGKHKGKYDALVQFGNVFRGWRDADHDGNLDMTGKVHTDVKGLNFHTTRWDKKVMRVGDFSEGCQVCEVAQEYDRIMVDVIYKSEQALFSYALFEEK